MRTTLAIDDDQLATARELAGLKETSALVREALTRLIQSEALRRLARMGGSDPNAGAGPRRRSEPDLAHADLEHPKASSLIERRRLVGVGLGHVAMHLLASTMLQPDLSLLTRDRRLAQAATRLGVCAAPL